MNNLNSIELIKENDKNKKSFLNGWNDYQKENIGNIYETDDFDTALRYAENLKDNGSLNFLNNWYGEIQKITEIETLEFVVDSDKWELGIKFIPDEDFDEDFEETEDFEKYLEVEFRGTSYFYEI